MDPDHIPTTTTVVATTDQDQSAKTTTEETDQINNEMGSGRSYECVFCKRGFTTAQALGGHMNIHRKDRVKTKPNTPSKPEPFSNHPSTLRPTSTTTAAAVTTISHHQSFQTYFPTSSTWCLGTTTSSPPHDHQFSYVHNNPQVSNTFKDQNWTTTNMNLASQALPTLALNDRRDKRSDSNGGGDDDDEELDLELRLGHDR